MAKNIHVVKSGDHWEVKEEKNPSPLAQLRTQTDAIQYAREIAQLYKTRVLIHGRSGKIKGGDSYGNDPYPPEG